MFKMLYAQCKKDATGKEVFSDWIDSGEIWDNLQTPLQAIREAVELDFILGEYHAYRIVKAE